MKYYEVKIGSDKTEIHFIEVPAGDFIMGSDKMHDERPEHIVHLVGTFCISQNPVTNAQYAVFVHATGHTQPAHWRNGKIPPGKENHPVVNVSWNDAIAFCRWLSERTGLSITLPSEAEWEKAARGTDGREYPWGDGWDETKCHCVAWGSGGPIPVGIFQDGVSPYGVHDMAGNVWEWTLSLYGDYPYDSADGRENLDTSGPRVLRGGSFANSEWFARCACRARRGPDDLGLDRGFRVVLH